MTRTPIAPPRAGKPDRARQTPATSGPSHEKVLEPGCASNTPHSASRAPGEPLPRLLSLAEVSEALGCSPKTLQRRIRAGELPVIRNGRLVRVHPRDLERFIAGRRSL